jgi:hypothetical protein
MKIEVSKKRKHNEIEGNTEYLNEEEKSSGSEYSDEQGNYGDSDESDSEGFVPT